MADDIDKRLDEDYVTPYLNEDEVVDLRISTTTSTGGWAALLDTLGPLAIFTEALFSEPAFAVLTDRRLMVSFVTLVRGSRPAETVDFSGLDSVRLRRGPFHKSLSVRTSDGRRYRMTVMTWNPFKSREDPIDRIEQALSNDARLPQPA